MYVHIPWAKVREAHTDSVLAFKPPICKSNSGGIWKAMPGEACSERKRSRAGPSQGLPHVLPPLPFLPTCGQPRWGSPRIEEPWQQKVGEQMSSAQSCAYAGRSGALGEASGIRPVVSAPDLPRLCSESVPVTRLLAFWLGSCFKPGGLLRFSRDARPPCNQPAGRSRSQTTGNE